MIYLAIAKEYEPVLLLPIGFGCILANIPMTGMTDSDGLLGILYEAGIATELFPLLIFIGVGAMIDFSPLLAQPKMVLLGAAGQFGIFGVLILAIMLGFDLNEAASIGVIGAIDGPYFHLRSLQTGTSHAGAYCRSGIFIHESDPDHPAAHHAADDHPPGTPNSDGVRATPHFQTDVGLVPCAHQHLCRAFGTRSFAFDRQPYVRKPLEGKWSCGQAEQIGSE